MWELRFAEAGRRCGTEHADAARVLVLHGGTPRRGARDPAVPPGDGRRTACGPARPGRTRHRTRPALPLVEDALRANDTPLLAAALGPYAARHLDAHQWRHAVLKCLFTGVPVARWRISTVRAARGRGTGQHARAPTPPSAPPPAVPSPRPPPRPARPRGASRSWPGRPPGSESCAHLRPPHPHDVPDHRRLRGDVCRGCPCRGRARLLAGAAPHFCGFLL
ncbi:EboA domain-containing protein [Streptomyces rochei]